MRCREAMFWMPIRSTGKSGRSRPRIVCTGCFAVFRGWNHPDNRVPATGLRGVVWSWLNGGRVQPRSQPAQDPSRQTRHAPTTNADVSIRQPPDVGLPPRLPEVLDILLQTDQIMD